jgi:hypothetical protein
METDQEVLKKRHRSGLSWLMTIAVLSILNMIVLFAKLNLMFPVGLGTSTLAATFLIITPEENVAVARFIGLFLLLVSLLIIGILFFCRVKAKKEKAWGYMLGMILYGLDALICLWFRDWVSLAFHAWGLLAIGMGYAALRKLNRLALVPESGELVSPADLKTTE